MQRIAILTAMRSEYNTVLQSLNQIQSFQLEKGKSKNHYKQLSGYIDKKRIFILKTGVGYQKAKQAIQCFLKDNKIDIVINVGIAGAINPDLSIGDLILCKSIIHENNPAQILTTDKINTNKLQQKCRQMDIPFNAGCAINVLKPLGNDQQRKLFYNNYHADIVDMESFVFIEECVQNKIPFVAIKTISDKADNNINFFKDMFDSNGQIQITKLIKIIFMHPIRFYKNYRQLISGSKTALYTLFRYVHIIIEAL